ncbi:MAG: molybdenum cofactor biosynthesis protein MoaE [Burkholderiaceae bacterium]
MMAAHVRIQTESFDQTAELAMMHGGDLQVGALASFTGLVRRVATPPEHADAPQSLFIEHYPGMTESYLTALSRQARTRFAIHASAIIHRVGMLQPGEGIVLVAVTAPHRAAALHACDYLMDHLKNHAPFWKKQIVGDMAHWVQPHPQDAIALQRW